MKLLTVKEVRRLETILCKTKRNRIRKKLIKRLVEGTFSISSYERWFALDSSNRRDENGCIILPSFEELARLNNEN